MSDLFSSTKLSAYYLWEETGHSHALNLWYLAEDIACFFARDSIMSSESVKDILAQDSQAESYLWLVRNIAFRIFIYTDNPDATRNWYIAERLLFNDTWLESVIDMANFLNEDSSGLRSNSVKMLYGM